MNATTGDLLATSNHVTRQPRAPVIVKPLTSLDRDRRRRWPGPYLQIVVYHGRRSGGTSVPRRDPDPGPT